MNPEQFMYWLKGVLDSNEVIDEEGVAHILKTIDSVIARPKPNLDDTRPFIKEWAPWSGDPMPPHTPYTSPTIGEPLPIVRYTTTNGDIVP